MKKELKLHDYTCYPEFEEGILKRYVVCAKNSKDKNIYTVVKTLKLTSIGQEDNLSKSVEEQTADILNYIEWPFYSIKGNYNKENIHDTMVGYAVAVSDENFEEADEIAQGIIEQLQTALEIGLKATVVPWTLRDSWVIERIEKPENIAIFVGQPKYGPEYTNESNTRYNSKTESNSNIMSDIYAGLADETYIIISAAYPMAREEIIDLVDKAAKKLDLLKYRSKISQMNSTNFSVPILGNISEMFGYGNGLSDSHADNAGTASSNAHSTGDSNNANESFGHSNQHSNGITHQDGKINGESHGNTGSLGGSVIVGNYSNSHNDSSNSSNSSSSGTNSSDSFGDTSGASKGTSHNVSNTDSTSQNQSHTDGYGNSLNTSQNILQSINTGFVFGQGDTTGVSIENIIYTEALYAINTHLLKLKNGLVTSVYYSGVTLITDKKSSKYKISSFLQQKLRNTNSIETFKEYKLNKEEEFYIIKKLKHFEEPSEHMKNRFSIEDKIFLTIMESSIDSTKSVPNTEMKNYTYNKKVIPPKFFRWNTDRETFKHVNSEHIHIPLCKLINPDTNKVTNELLKMPYLFHNIIAGDSGNAKTTLGRKYAVHIRSEFNIPVIIFNNKEDDDYRVLKRLSSGFSVNIYELGLLCKDTFYFNPMEIPEGVHVSEWSENITQTLCRMMGMGSRSKYILKNTINEQYSKNEIKDKIDERLINEIGSDIKHGILDIYAQKGIIDGIIVENREDSKNITLVDLFEKIQGMYNKEAMTKPTDFKKLETLSSLIDKLSSILSNPIFRRITSSKRSIPLEQFIKNKNVIVFNTIGLSDDERQLLSDTMVKYLFFYAKRNHIKNRMGQDNPFMVMIEEANILFDSITTSKAGDEQVNKDIWAEIAAAGRSYGMFFTLIVQFPSKLPDYILSSAGIFMVMGLKREEDKSLMLSLIGYDAQRQDIPKKNWLGDLPVGWVVLKYSRNFVQQTIAPMLGYVEPIDIE